jgi:hypothetical protein
VTGASAEGKQHKRKSQEQEILPGTAYKTFIEVQEKEIASKIREGRAGTERVEGAQEKEESGSKK